MIVGATCVSPVAEGEMRIDDRWSKSLGFLSLSQKSKISDWGIVTFYFFTITYYLEQSLRHGLRRATSLYTREDRLQ